MTSRDGRRIMAERCRVQAGWCERLGSPLYAELLRRCAEDIERGGALWTLLADRVGDPEEFYTPLRLLGSVHRVVLRGAAPALAAHYPSVGGRPGPGVWAAFRAIVEEHEEDVRGLLDVPPQTNEVGRSASLVGGFLLLTRERRLPLRLLEVGTSAGLNLRWDRYRYASGDWSWGDPASPLRFDDVFEGDAAPPNEPVEVQERRGCDLQPLDPGSEEGRLTLLSYVWPDQVQRIERLRAALRIARLVPAAVERADAVEWLGRELADDRAGSATVVFHSIVLGYLEEVARRRLVDLIEDAGRRATADAPLAWLSLERVGDRFEVRLRSWPGGEDRLVALSNPHGPPVRWLAG